MYKRQRYGKGDGYDYLNCPMNKEQYQQFYQQLVTAEVTPLHHFEQEKHFAGCMPIESMARYGEDAIRFGPMKPVGLELPGGGEAYAVVQLRKENKQGSAYNMVGFQTRLRQGEQRRVFHMTVSYTHLDVYKRQDNDYWADDIRYDAKGVSFTLHHQELTAEFSSSLLGVHMVSNILAALAVADQLGVSVRQMQRAVKALPPIEHRLQLRPAGDYFIIDDAFNSNPAGAAAALEVLAAFGEGKKIIITPGMVELGEREYQLNFEFGGQMAQVCDYIILVGKKHSKPLYDGVIAANYPLEQLFVAADLNEARRQLAKIVEPVSYTHLASANGCSDFFSIAAAIASS